MVRSRMRDSAQGLLWVESVAGASFDDRVVQERRLHRSRVTRYTREHVVLASGDGLDS